MKQKKSKKQTANKKTRVINGYTLTQKEDEIVGILSQYKRSMTMGEITEKTGLSWGTVNNYIIKSLAPKKIVIKEEWNGQEYWLLNY